MELTQERDEVGYTIYRLVIPDIELVRCKLYQHDWLLLNECEQSGLISDKLLGLETIARRIEGVKIPPNLRRIQNNG